MVLAAMQSGVFAMAGPKESKPVETKKSTVEKSIVSKVAKAKSFDYSGTSYEATVPDTLDLADRAALAINGLGGTIDPNLDYLPYGATFFADKTPHMHHWSTADNGCIPKYGESFSFMRIMSGSKQYLELESKTRDAMLARVEDGLYWDRYDPRRPWRDIYAASESLYGKGSNEDICIPSHAARMFRAVLVWRNLCDDPMLDEVAGSLSRGMRRIAIDRDDYSYYPEKGGWAEATSYPRSGWLNTDEAKSEIEGVEGTITGYHAHPIYAAAHWYEASGDPVALELATRLTKYCMQPKFWGGMPNPGGSMEGLTGNASPFSPDPPYKAGAELGHWFSHFHARATVLRGILEYARVASDQRAMEFVRRAYEYTLTQGIPRIGWINCFPAKQNEMEACALGDMVALGIRLSDMGLGDYWDDVDAVVRNHLAEQQLTRRDIIEQISAACGEKQFHSGVSKQYGPAVTERVIERGMGVFLSNSKPTSVAVPFTMLCCTGNATQGLYYAWEGIVRESGDTAQVNLLLNRAAKLLDVDSYLPYEGKVVLRNKAARRISVRIPYWVTRKDIRANVSGKETALDWLDNNLVFSNLKPTDVITLTFPVKETTSSYTVNAHSPDEKVYTCTFRGSTCVDISPRDTAKTNYPMYLRDHMKTGKKAPMKKKTRFVSDKTVLNW